MIPAPLWGINLRQELGKTRWNKIRKHIIAERGLKCESCSKVETESSRIYAHEEWEYKTKGKSGVASLRGLKLSCWHCHAIAHFGRTRNMVLSGELTERSIEDTIKHFCRLNGIGRDQFETHLAAAETEWMRLSQLTWKVDWQAFKPMVAEAQQKRSEAAL
jgi:hypothetical protein